MRRHLVIAAGLPLLAAGALAAVVVASGEDTPAGNDGGGTGARGSEVVERRTLVDSATVDGTLGYGASRPALDRRGGTLTWLPRSGATIRPGERIFEVDGEPVILLNGTTPAWRAMTVGDEGADVLQLERNLAALGHDPGTVDDAFTSATAAAVRAWQEAWGVPESGRVALGDVVFLPGARRVSKLTGALGEGGGGQPANWTGGELQTSFASDTTTPTTETTPPVTTPGTTPTAPAPAATSPQTTPAQPQTGTTPSTTTPGRTTPGTTTPNDDDRGEPAQPSGGGDDAPAGGGSGGGGSGGGGDDDGSGTGTGTGTEVLQTTATRRVVTAEVDAADQTLARVGARATVELPGGARVAGRIVRVGTVATGGGDGEAPGGEEQQDPTVPVTIELRSERGAGRLDQAPVIVELARETRRNVLAVPVTALIARAGGGYAVSLVRAGRTRLVPVRPGLFADGYVELRRGSAVRAGDRVQVPR